MLTPHRPLSLHRLYTLLSPLSSFCRLSASATSSSPARFDQPRSGGFGLRQPDRSEEQERGRRFDNPRGERRYGNVRREEGFGNGGGRGGGFGIKRGSDSGGEGFQSTNFSPRSFSNRESPAPRNPLTEETHHRPPNFPRSTESWSDRESRSFRDQPRSPPSGEAGFGLRADRSSPSSSAVESRRSSAAEEGEIRYPLKPKRNESVRGAGGWLEVYKSVPAQSAGGRELDPRQAAESLSSLRTRHSKSPSSSVIDHLGSALHPPSAEGTAPPFRRKSPPSTSPSHSPSRPSPLASPAPEAPSPRPPHWSPTKRVSLPTMAGLKALHMSDPIKYTASFLSLHFGISHEGVRRILRSRFREMQGAGLGEGELDRGGGGKGGEDGRGAVGTKWDRNPGRNEGRSPVGAIRKAFRGKRE